MGEVGAHGVENKVPDGLQEGQGAGGRAVREAAAHGVTDKVLYDQVDCQGAGGRDLRVAGENGVTNKVPDGQHETWRFGCKRGRSSCWSSQFN